MPCDSSHLEPRYDEVNSAKLLELLREIEGKVFNHNHPREIYGRVETLDRDTARLCEWCKTHDVTKQSLELQIWWRDHQEADVQKAIDGVRIKTERALRQLALSKLTPEERRALKVEE